MAIYGTLSTGTNLKGAPFDVVSYVDLNGVSNFGFSVAAYPQYIVYLSNIGQSSSGSSLILKGSYDGGSSYSSTWNWVEQIWFIGGTTSINNNSSSAGSQGQLFYNLWSGTQGAIGGHVTIQGTSWNYTNTSTYKRLGYEGLFFGQSPPNQDLHVCGGQTQDDSHAYNYVLIGLTSGTFNNGARAIVCGVKTA